jgi:hypothetical protein
MPCIPNMGALTKFDISNNQLGSLAHPEWSDTGHMAGWMVGPGWETGERRWILEDWRTLAISILMLMAGNKMANQKA